MSLQKLIRWVVGAAAFVGAIIVTLNVERIAQMHRLDQLLVDPAQSGLLALAQRPSVIVLAAVTMGVGIGLWTDSIARAATRKRPVVQRWEVGLGERMVSMAQRLGAIADNGIFYDSHDRRTTSAELILLLEEIDSKGIPIKQSILDGGAGSDILLNYLTHVGTCLSRGDLPRAKLIADQFLNSPDAG